MGVPWTDNVTTQLEKGTMGLGVWLLYAYWNWCDPIELSSRNVEICRIFDFGENL